MKRWLVLVTMMAATALVMAVEPADGVREAGRCWRDGAIKQDKALLQRCLADDLVYTHSGGKSQWRSLKLGIARELALTILAKVMDREIKGRLRASSEWADPSLSI